MATKRRYRLTSRKSRLRRRTGSRRTGSRRTGSRRTKSKSQSHRRRCIRGGNYETDVTTHVYQGFPMKPSNKVVTTVPGYGVMSVTAYKNLQESLDRNGKDLYD